MATIKVGLKGSKTSYVLKKITEEDFNIIYESLLFHEQSQKFFTDLREQIRNSDEYREFAESDSGIATRRIKELSQAYRQNYSVLMNNYSDWKPRRQHLIKILNIWAEKLDRHFNYVCYMRIFGSTADLVGNIMRIVRENEVSFAGISVGSFSMIGLFSILIEKIISKASTTFVKKTLEEDQEIFRKIKEWFKQTEELDRAVKSFFPFGIDEDMARKINEFAQDVDEFSKIFMSVVASNVKKDINLYNDRQFLDKAELFSTSEVGVQWFHKVILERDPIFIECFSVGYEAKIQQAMRSCDVEQADLCMNFPMKMCKQKAVLDIINIYATVANMVLEVNNEKTDPIRELAKKTEEELRNVRKLIVLLGPDVIKLRSEDAE